MTITQFKRLTKAERGHHLQKLAMMLAMTRYQIDHPGCDPDLAFAHSKRTWRNFYDTALDLVAIEAALEERAIESN